MSDIFLKTRKTYSSLSYTMEKNKTWYEDNSVASGAHLFTYLFTAVDTLKELSKDQDWADSMELTIARIISTFNTGHKILCCGAGGSLHDHFVAELVNRFTLAREYPFPAIDLSGSTCTMSAISNDYGYEYAFAKQVLAIGNEDDLFIGFSTSAKTNAVLRAIKAAKSKRMYTILFTGSIDFDPEIEKGVFAIPHLYVKMKSKNTARIQEQTLVSIHAICSYLDTVLTDKQEIK